MVFDFRPESRSSSTGFPTFNEHAAESACTAPDRDEISNDITWSQPLVCVTPSDQRVVDYFEPMGRLNQYPRYEGFFPHGLTATSSHP